MQKEIQRVNVIVERLFEIHSIRPDLAFRLSQNNLQALLLPPAGSRYLRTKRPDKEQGHGLADQVRIRGEVRRQVPFDISAVPCKPTYKIAIKGGWRGRAAP